LRPARRTFLASMMASAAAAALPPLVRAEAPQVTLKLHHFFSSVSCGHDRFLAPWARKVEAESGRRIRIDIFPSMQLGGARAQLLDQARDGVADIVWAVPGDSPGRYPKIEVFELPFLASRRALVNSRALEDYAAANLQDEFRDVHPISFSCRDRSVVHANRPVRTIGDLRGLRLHVSNRLAGETVDALGARAVGAPIPQVPMAIAGHVIDGCLDPWDMVPALKLQDLLNAHADLPESSLSTTAFVLAMNKATYDRLPRELRKVIDNNSGQIAAGMAGAMWDLEADAVADMVRQRGDPITMLTAEDVERGRKATEPVVATWLKAMKAQKIDGDKLVAGAGALLAKYASEPEPQPPAPPKPAEPKANALPQVQAPQAKADAAIQPNVRAPAPAPIIKRVPGKGSDIPL
jgi:TRAP-type transport system periplasmic protein